MIVTAYYWYLIPRLGVGNSALRQGVISATTELEARVYLESSMTKEETSLLQSRNNLLIITPLHAWETE